MSLSEKLRKSGVQALEDLADFVGMSEQEKRRRVRHLEGKSEVDHAYEMGRDYHDHGPSDFNCHHTIFATQEQKEAWERGFKDAKRGGGS